MDRSSGHINDSRRISVQRRSSEEGEGKGLAAGVRGRKSGAQGDWKTCGHSLGSQVPRLGL